MSLLSVGCTEMEPDYSHTPFSLGTGGYPDGSSGKGDWGKSLTVWCLSLMVLVILSWTLRVWSSLRMSLKIAPNWVSN